METDTTELNLEELLLKLKPDEFELVVGTIINLVDTEKKFKELADLIFKKVVNEPNFALFYAKLSYRICENLFSNNQLSNKDKNNKKKFKLKRNIIFRNILLDKVECEFTKNFINKESKENLYLILNKLKNCNDTNKKLELRKQLTKEADTLNKRCCGITLFIGGLFKWNLLTGNIMHYCFNALLNSTSEDQLECLCRLLKISGKKYESTLSLRSSKLNGKYYSLQPVISHFQLILDTKRDILSSKVSSLIKEVIKLQKNNWQT